MSEEPAPAAREGAGLLDAILQAMPHGICVFGRNLVVRAVNPAYNTIMDGFAVSVGDGLQDILDRRIAAGEFAPGDVAFIHAQLLTDGADRGNTWRRRRPNGQTVDIQVIPLGDGGRMCVVTDVTALVEAEAELSQRAEAMDLMLANIRHGIVLWDSDRRIIASNAVVHDILGAPPGFMVRGTTLEAVIVGALQRGNLGAGEVGLRRAQFLREQDRSRSHVDQRLTSSGRVFEVRSDPTPGGGFVTTYTDITLIREAEIALREAKAEAEAANAGKSRFLAAMSNELRTPLRIIREGMDSVVRSAADGVARAGRSTADGAAAGHVAQAARRADVAARGLSAVIDTILDVARLEAGRYDLAEGMVDITQMVGACVRSHDPAAAAAEVALVADLPPALPQVRGDERRLRQALAHLVGNALKFTGAMGSVSITAHCREDLGGLRVEVADSGIGIADAEMGRVFEPFFRGADAGGAAPGAGLGLYISRALMRAHGGDVVLRSRAGHGTTAIMLVPASRVMHHHIDAPI